MNAKQEKDIIRTLVKAGHESLAKTFACSRGYRVKAEIDDLDAYWMNEMIPAIRKGLAKATKDSGAWKLRGRGALNKRKGDQFGQLELIVDPLDRSLAMRVVIGLGYYQKHDGDYSIFMGPTSAGTHESHERMTGNAAADAKKLLSDYTMMLQDMAQA